MGLNVQQYKFPGLFYSIRASRHACLVIHALAPDWKPLFRSFELVLNRAQTIIGWPGVVLLCLPYEYSCMGKATTCRMPQQVADERALVLAVTTCTASHLSLRCLRTRGGIPSTTPDRRPRTMWIPGDYEGITMWPHHCTPPPSLLPLARNPISAPICQGRSPKVG